jgi:hypothetical protein
MDLELAHLADLAVRNLEMANTAIESALEFARQVRERAAEPDRPKPMPAVRQQPALAITASSEEPEKKSRGIVKGSMGYTQLVRAYLEAHAGKAFTRKDVMEWARRARQEQYDSGSVGAALSYLRAHKEISGDGKGLYHAVS